MRTISEVHAFSTTFFPAIPEHTAWRRNTDGNCKVPEGKSAKPKRSLSFLAVFDVVMTNIVSVLFRFFVLNKLSE